MTEATYAQKPRDKNKTEQIVGMGFSGFDIWDYRR